MTYTERWQVTHRCNDLGWHYDNTRCFDRPEQWLAHRLGRDPITLARKEPLKLPTAEQIATLVRQLGGA